MSAHSASRPLLPVLTILALLISLVASLALARPVAAQTDLIFDLSGEEEVPGPGDEDGFGFGSVLIDAEAGEVCTFIEVIDIAAATAAHIHAGAAGVAGPIVVTLPTPGADGIAEGCIDGLDSTVLQAIIDDPAGHYVNVHNTDFPDGAVRGQLREAPPEPDAHLFADLIGAAEVPGPGDPDGFGFVDLPLWIEAGELCVFIGVEEIAPATAAHIHAGAAGVEGPVVVTLPTPDADGFAEGCVDGLDQTLLQAIADDPSAYYVNVHNAEYPAGAVRGQLSDEHPAPPECEPGELCDGLLAPGTYTYTGFGTDVTFTTVTEWIAHSDEIPSLTLWDDALHGGLFAFPHTGDVYADPCDFESATTIGESPAELMAWLTDRPFLSSSAVTDVTYGGASGLQVDIVATVPPECTDPPWVLVWVLPIVTDFHFEEGSVARIVALDVDGETILFIAESLPDGNPDAFRANAQGVLDSLVWALADDDDGATPTPSASPIPLPDTAVGAGGTAAVPWSLGAVLLLALSAMVVVKRRAAIGT